MSKRTILVADDETIIRDLAKRCLGEYIVIEAADGVQALESARSIHPDLILLDIMMPKIDGYTVCQKLKADVETSTIPIVMVTGLGFSLNARLSQSLGADGYITKPFTVKELTDTVKRFFA
jgi:two-component system alkaline phosphatase synthesis response regulator PhoP